MQKELNAHISLHITASNPTGTLVVQPRNADGTFRSPVRASEASARSFHSINYTESNGSVIRGTLG